MNRLEESLIQVAAWRRGALGSLMLLSLAGLAGCPSDPNGQSDMGNANQDMPSDAGGIAKLPKPGCSIDEWCWMFPQPQGNTLWSVWGSSGTDVWAVGDGGAIIHYAAGQWRSVPSTAKNRLWSVWGSAANDIWAVGDRAALLHYDGQSWSDVPVAGGLKASESLFAVWGTGKDDVWMVGTNGVVLHKTGSGLSRVAQSKTMARLSGVFGTGGKLWVIGADGTVLTTSDAGASWDSSTISNGIDTVKRLVAIAGTDANNIFVSTELGEVYRYNGNAWMRVNDPAPDNYGLYGLWALGSDVFAVGDLVYTDMATHDETKRKGTILKWNGSQFDKSLTANAPLVSLFGIWGSSASNLFMVGLSGTVVRFDGTTFVSSSPIDSLTGIGAPFVGISGTEPNNLVTVGDWGGSLRWNGTQWTPITSITPPLPNGSVYLRFRALSGPIDNLWAAAFDATPGKKVPALYQLQGNGWTAVNLPPNATDIQGLSVIGSDLFTVGLNEVILRRSSGTWSGPFPVNQPFAGTAWRGVWGTDSTHVYIVGGGDFLNDPKLQSMYPGRVLFFNGGSVSPVVTTPNFETLFAVWGADATHIFAVGDKAPSGQAIIMATSDGINWKPQPSGTPFPLHGVFGISPTDVYAVGDNGTLLHYDGSTWSRQESGTTANLQNIWGVGKDLYITGNAGAVLHRKLP